MTIKPDGRGPQILGIYSFFVGLTTITLALRLYCRAYIQKAFGWDDYTAAFAWVSFVDRILSRAFLTWNVQAFYIIFASCAMTGVHHGTGQHAWVIPADELPQGLKVRLYSFYRSPTPIRMTKLTLGSSGGFASPSTWFPTCSSRPVLVLCCSAFPSTQCTKQSSGPSSPLPKSTASVSSSSSYSNACRVRTSGLSSPEARERAWILS